MLQKGLHLVFFCSVAIFPQSFFENYLLLAVLCFCCCTGFSLVVMSWGYSLVAVHRLLIAAPSLVVEHVLQGALASAVMAQGLNSCGSQVPEHRLDGHGTWVQLLHGMWDLPRLGIGPGSPALEGKFFTTEPPKGLFNSFKYSSQPCLLVLYVIALYL